MAEDLTDEERARWCSAAFLAKEGEDTGDAWEIIHTLAAFAAAASATEGTGR